MKGKYRHLCELTSSPNVAVPVKKKIGDKRKERRNKKKKEDKKNKDEKGKVDHFINQ